MLKSQSLDIKIKCVKKKKETKTATIKKNGPLKKESQFTTTYTRKMSSFNKQCFLLG